MLVLDSLIKSCLEELAMDGDWGCDIPTLLSHLLPPAPAPPLSSDPALTSYLWSLLVAQPSFQVGLATPELQKALRGEAPPLKKGEEPPELFELLQGEDREGGLDALRERWGTRLRVRVDKETCFVTITGSHVRPARLSHHVYTCLQLVSRGRQKGMTVIDLGRATGFDQKSIFYFVKCLVEMQLVAKMRTTYNKAWTNLVVHRRFLGDCPQYQAHQAEDAVAAAGLRSDDEGEGGDENANAEGEDVGDGDEGITFTPLTNEHLANKALLRARILSLLRASKHGVILHRHILVRIGYANPNRPARRFFTRFIQGLISEGVIERVGVPSPRSSGRILSCLRFPGGPTTLEGAALPEDVKEDDEEVEGEEEEVQKDFERGVGVVANTTLERQMVDLLIEADTAGMTFSDIRSALSSINKRTIEAIITRLEVEPPPPHLADLSVCSVMETLGRERRQRYFTKPAYARLCVREGIAVEGDTAAPEPGSTGGFAEWDADAGVSSARELKKWVGGIDVSTQNSGGRKKGGRKSTGTPAEKKPRGRPRKYERDENGKPIVPGKATPKLRPSKRRKVQEQEQQEGEEGQAVEQPGLDEWVDAEPGAEPGAEASTSATPAQPSSSALPTSAASPSAATAATPTPAPGRKRGRASKGNLAVSSPAQSTPAPASAPKKRGRPSKADLAARAAAAEAAGGASPSTPAPESLPKKRGHQSKEDQAGEGEGAPAENETATPAPLPKKRGRPSKADLAARVAAASSSPAPAPPTKKARTEPEGPEPESEDEQQPQPQFETGEAEPAPASARDKGKGRAVEPQDDAGAEQEQTPMDVDGDGQEQPALAPEPAPTPARPQALAIATPTATPSGSRAAALAMPPPSTTRSARSKQIDLPKPRGAPRRMSRTPSASPAPFQTPRQATPSPFATPGPSTLAGTPLKPVGGMARTLRSLPRTDLTKQRRENEILYILDKHGGVLEGGPNLVKLHAEFNDEQASRTAAEGSQQKHVHGTRIDKKTLTSALEGLGRRGLVKELIIQVPGIGGTFHRRSVVYKTDLDPASPEVRAVVAELRHRLTHTVHRPRAKKMLADGANFDRPTEQWYLDGAPQATKVNVLALPENPQDPAQADAVREILLTEWRTCAQQYGYIIGKVARLRQLHLSLVDELQRPHAERASSLVSAEQRIFSIDYFSVDLPLEVHLRTAALTVDAPHVLEQLSTLEGRRARVGTLPRQMREVAQIAHGHHRARLEELLRTLINLRIIVPLQAATSPTPYLNLGPVAFGRPTAYDTAYGKEFPSYFQLAQSVPLFAFSVEGAPFIGASPTTNSIEVTTYWAKLEQGAFKKQLEDGPAPVAPEGYPQAFEGPESLVRSLKRPHTWRPGYALSPTQKVFLEEFVDYRQAQTPLQDEAALKRIAHASVVPIDFLREYFANAGERAHVYKVRIEAKEGKAARKREQEAKARDRKLADEAKNRIAAKAAEAKAQLENDWTAILRRVLSETPELSATLVDDEAFTSTKEKFISSSGHTEISAFEAQIRAAAKRSRRAATPAGTATPGTAATPARAAKTTMPVRARKKASQYILKHPVQTPQGKSVASLVEDQNDRDIELPAADSARKRRRRFQWTPDLDELARDTIAIVRARTREGNRINFGAITQVFPHITVTTFRTHIKALSQRLGEEGYLSRLEDAWYELWVDQRGTDELPDPDLRDMATFDLAAHIECLRKHIDKRALWLGTSSQITPSEPPPEMPLDVSSLLAKYRVVDSEVTDADPFVKLFENVTSDVNREKLYQSHALAVAPLSTSASTDVAAQAAAPEHYLAKSAIKGTVAVPEGEYDVQAATDLLQSIGENAFNPALAELIDSGILMRIQTDRAQPGRTYKFTETFNNCVDGAMPVTFAEGVAEAEEMIEREDWMTWPLVAPDTTHAALLHSISEDLLEVEIDVSDIVLVGDLNSRKIDDDELEGAVHVRLNHDKSPFILPDVLPRRTDAERALGEESEESRWSAVETLAANEDSRRLLVELRSILQQKGEVGATKEDIETDISPAALELIPLVIGGTSPAAFLAGYDRPRLVSSAFASSWVITFPGVGKRAPRLWLDLHGDTNHAAWQKAIVSVFGWLTFRPGMIEAKLRERLRLAYDRLEFSDVVDTLIEAGLIERRFTDGQDPGPLRSLADESRAFLVMKGAGFNTLMPSKP